ncbi:MAG TPA: hypothetical protein DCR04_07235 [Flavobacteriales bacterium]|nr:hypothetical protein [Flavobacteriales bacterium]
MVKTDNVLVTGIGGNVGQGVMRNISSSDVSVRIIGCNVEPFTAGNHMASKVYHVPFADKDSYVSIIAEIVKNEEIDLIIPTTDLETFTLANARSSLGCDVAASDAEVCEGYLDKYLSWERHTKYGIPFVDSLLPSMYTTGKWDSIIVKPRRGKGSRDLHINPDDVSQFNDNDYIVQPYIEGIEVTTGFYVSLKGKLHAHISLIRSLENGATSSCEVTTEYDHLIVPMLEKMVEAGGLRGSVNVQSRITKENGLFPFEVNCRVSGTNSIRSHFGFKDVEYLLQENLLKVEPESANIIQGKALRVLMDVIYPNCKDSGTDINSQTPHIVF